MSKIIPMSSKSICSKNYYTLRKQLRLVLSRGPNLSQSNYKTVTLKRKKQLTAKSIEMQPYGYLMNVELVERDNL